jgi:hypothetical protein
MIALVSTAMIAAVPASASAAAPPCLNYESVQEGGRVTVDLRPDETGAQTVLTIFWFINGSAAGTYGWQHFVNGNPVGGRQVAVKDDNLHTAFRSVENSGGTVNWRFGDVYHFDATHFAPSENTTYITPVNECVITPR